MQNKGGKSGLWPYTEKEINVAVVSRELDLFFFILMKKKQHSVDFLRWFRLVALFLFLPGAEQTDYSDHDG